MYEPEDPLGACKGAMNVVGIEFIVIGIIWLVWKVFHG